MLEKQNNNLKGFLLINKPKNISSFDCIRKIKKVLKKRIKIGHTGTLDNFATGLLIIAIDRSATRLIGKLMNLDKEYIVTAKLGELTDTLDCTGEVLKTIPIETKKDEILKIVESFPESYEQIPPIYSALKFEGKPLYQMARNKTITREELDQITKEKKRTVKIYNMSLINYQAPFFSLKAMVSKGTYIRSLANDIAKKLETHATCYKLQRSQIGPFKIENSINLEELTTEKVILEKLLPIENIINKLSE